MKNAQSIIWSQLAIDYKCEFVEGGYQFSRSKNGEPKKLITKFTDPDILARKFTSECLRDFLSIHPGFAKYNKQKEPIIAALEKFHSKWGVFPNTDFVKGSEAILLLITKKQRYLIRYNESGAEELKAKIDTAQKDKRVSTNSYYYHRAEFNLNVSIGVKDIGTQVVPCFQPTNLFQALEIALILGWHLETPTECKSSQVLGQQRPINCKQYFPRTRRDKEFCSNECRGSYHRTIKQKESK